MSGPDPKDLLRQYTESLSHVLPKAVGTNLILWSSVSVCPFRPCFPRCSRSPRPPQLGTVLLFNILRPRNKVFPLSCPPLPAAAAPGNSAAPGGKYNSPPAYRPLPRNTLAEMLL